MSTVIIVAALCLLAAVVLVARPWKSGTTGPQAAASASSAQAGQPVTSAGQLSEGACIDPTTHPLRHLVTGIAGADPGWFSLRPPPVAAVLALDALAGWSPGPAREAHAVTRAVLAADRSLRILGDASRQASTGARVPVLLGMPDQEPPPGIWWSKSGAQILPCIPGDGYEAAAALLARVKLAALATARPFAEHGPATPNAEGEAARGNPRLRLG